MQVTEVRSQIGNDKASQDYQQQKTVATPRTKGNTEDR